MVVVVTGSSGQLGQSLQLKALDYPEIQFVFYNSEELDITNFHQCETVFERTKPHYCINTAAYTAVDKAESEPDKAYKINVTGVKNLAEVAKKHATIVLHVSTDFVFDGSQNKPYTEDDSPNPTGVYGRTKLEGERILQQIWAKHYIVRTSWVYSPFGHNFMKTMLRLATERDSISVVNDQIGTPTHAVDLADALIQIIVSNTSQPTTDNFGIYNFSNEGQCSWYDFAKRIFEVNNIKIDLHPIPTSAYPTPAQRPAYSVLDKSKIKSVFGLKIVDWQERCQPMT